MPKSGKNHKKKEDKKLKIQIEAEGPDATVKKKKSHLTWKDMKIRIL